MLHNAIQMQDSQGHNYSKTIAPSFQHRAAHCARDLCCVLPAIAWSMSPEPLQSEDGAILLANSVRCMGSWEGRVDSGIAVGNVGFR